MRSAAALGLFLLFVVGCSSTTTGTGGSSGSSSGSGSASGLVAVDADAFCDKYVNTCKATDISLADCRKTFAAMRVPSDCKQGFETATCAELSASSSVSLDLCFPRCDARGTAACNADGTVTTCSNDGRTYVVDCAALCSSQLSSTYSGTCGKAYGGQTSPTDKCWCR